MKASKLLKKRASSLPQVKGITSVFRARRFAGGCDTAARDTLYRVRDHVRALLNGRPTLESRLIKKHGIEISCGDLEHMKKLRQTRLAWIDDLIAYFESQGD